MAASRARSRSTLDPDRLNALGVTAGDVNRALRAANVDLTGGSADFSGRDQAIRTLGGAKTIADLEKLEIPLGGGRTRARCRTSPRSPMPGRSRNRFARVNSQTVVSFGIFRGKGASDVEVNERASSAAVAELQAAHPERGDQQGRQFGRPTPRATTNSAMETLLEGAALSVIVVLIFLRDIRATLVSAVALPLSIIPAFWAIDMMGFSLNLVSLLGITLVVGILVDDAIVEIENIVRHMKMGKTPYRAVARGGRRDRPGGHRDLRDHHGGVRAGVLHGRHRRPVLQAVRPDGGGRGVLLAAGRAAADADARRLFPARPRP